jgi:hypothetical protein
MNTTKQALWILAAGLTVAGVALPQKKEAPPKTPPPAQAPAAAPSTAQGVPSQVSLADLASADVMVEGGGAEKPAPGGEKGGEKGAEKGGEKPGRGEPADSPKGKVAELVFSTKDGQIAGAAISVGKILGTNEKIVLVPMSALKYSPIEKRPGFVLHMSKAELQSMQAFDVRNAEKEGLDRAVEQLRGGGGGGGDPVGKGAPKEPPKDPKEKGEGLGEGKGPGAGRGAGDPLASPGAVPEYVLFGQMKGCEVKAGDREFGKVQDGAVDVGRNAVGYVLVSPGGIASGGAKLHLVPMKACSWARAEEKNLLKLSKTPEQVAGAPEYKKPEQGFVTAEQMKSADEFWGGKGAVNPQ